MKFNFPQDVEGWLSFEEGSLLFELAQIQFIVGKAGVLVDTADLRAYSRALRMVVEENFGDKPRKQAEKFSWKKIAEKYKKRKKY